MTKVKGRGKGKLEGACTNASTAFGWTSSPNSMATFLSSLRLIVPALRKGDGASATQAAWQAAWQASKQHACLSKQHKQVTVWSKSRVLEATPCSTVAIEVNPREQVRGETYSLLLATLKLAGHLLYRSGG